LAIDIGSSEESVRAAANKRMEGDSVFRNSVADAKGQAALLRGQAAPQRRPTEQTLGYSFI